MNRDIEQFEYVSEIENEEHFEWLEDECSLFSLVVENLLNEEETLNSLKELIETMQENDCLIKEESEISDAAQFLESFPEWEEEKKQLQETMDAILSDYKSSIDDERSIDIVSTS